MGIMEYEIDYLRPYWVEEWMKQEKRKRLKLLKNKSQTHGKTNKKRRNFRVLSVNDKD